MFVSVHRTTLIALNVHPPKSFLPSHLNPLREVQKFRDASMGSYKTIVIGNKMEDLSQQQVSAGEAASWCQDRCVCVLLPFPNAAKTKGQSQVCMIFMFAYRGYEYFEASAKAGIGVDTAFEALVFGCEGSVRPPPSQSQSRSQQRRGSFGGAPSTSQQQKPQPQQGRRGSMDTGGSDPNSMSAGALKRVLERWGASVADCFEKQDLVKRYLEVLAKRAAYMQGVQEEKQVRGCEGACRACFCVCVFVLLSARAHTRTHPPT